MRAPAISALLLAALLSVSCEEAASRPGTPVSSPRASEVAVARTAATAPSGPVLVGAGDIASCDGDGDEATAAILDTVFAGGTEGVVFAAGDNAYELGTAEEFQECYGPSWGRHRARTRPAAGNHEYGLGDASSYFSYFGRSAGERGRGYYSYDLASWHVVVINTNCWAVGGCQAGSAQEQWLRTDLAASEAACAVAYWHHPLFSSGLHGSQTFMRDIWLALYEYGVDVVVNGHDHDYERFAPQNADGGADPQRGIREFVVGTGGESLYPFFGGGIENSEVRSSGAFGVLKLTLYADSYDWEFLPAAGATFTDSGSGPCH